MNAILVIEKIGGSATDPSVVVHDFDHDLMVANTLGEAIFLCMLWQPVEVVVNSEDDSDSRTLDWLVHREDVSNKGDAEWTKRKNRKGEACLRLAFQREEVSARHAA
ncbi:MAG: hypothetical protein HQM06_05700 [Magnetococcales bacterium]|nr:hypothetical protein [Magnetococcales bacterium]